MVIIKTIDQLQKVLDKKRREGVGIGFVPTMGCFHEGHLSLMRKAKKECDCCVVSIFVNPKQFGPKEDFVLYPRDMKRDIKIIKKENVDILFIPSDNEIYPSGYRTSIDVEKLSGMLCGQFRPGHFRGVATVVAKLLHIVQPSCVYLGQKDAQQVVVLNRMIEDLNFPVRVRVIPTMREADGLAMSSRNLRLTRAQRQQAPIVYRSLCEALDCVKTGERSVARIVKGIQQRILDCACAQTQYIACVDVATLEPLKVLRGKVLIAVSVFFGEIRLIDNVIISVQKSKKIKN